MITINFRCSSVTRSEDGYRVKLFTIETGPAFAVQEHVLAVRTDDADVANKYVPGKIYKVTVDSTPLAQESE